jgi:hypothetical protein
MFSRGNDPMTVGSELYFISLMGNPGRCDRKNVRTAVAFKNLSDTDDSEIPETFHLTKVECLDTTR